jgi:hypothetical protein
MGSFMSKNFELLQSLNKDQEVFDTGAELSPVSPLQIASHPFPLESEGKPIELQPLKLEMEEKQRDEVMKFVHHVFFMPEAEAPRTVVLTSAEPGNGCSWICCRAAQILASQGAMAPNAHTLLLSDPMRLRLAELRQYFEYVLIDAPALSLGRDSIVLGRAAEGVILVLKANSSRREAARKAVQDLQNAGVRILGAVLNQRTFPIPQVIYDKL